MSANDQKSLQLHKKYGGKLETTSKVPLNARSDLSVAYTPGVAAVCRLIAKQPSLAAEYTIKKNTVAVITDGSAILGLGNIGPLAGLPVMEGKAILLKKFAGINAFPICLDTQDTETIIRTVKIIAPVFAAIQLEDISAPRCFEIEKRLQKELDIPVMHDDQHSTAVVVLAALINALKVKKSTEKKVKVIIAGAGAAGVGIAKLLMAYGFKNLVILDSQGAIYSGRANLKDEKLFLAKKTNHQNQKGGLADCLKQADVFIGVSKGGVLKTEMVKTMNPGPIIFALANPDPEIMPAAALKAGALIVATGRSDFPNQINNVLAFPGIFRGAIDNKIRQVSQKMLLASAKNLAVLVKKPGIKKILPELFDKSVVKTIADAVKN